MITVLFTVRIAVYLLYARVGCRSENIECFIKEDQALSPSYDFAPPPTPPPLASLRERGGGGDWGGVGSRSDESENACSSKNHSILSSADV